MVALHASRGPGLPRLRRTTDGMNTAEWIIWGMGVTLLLCTVALLVRAIPTGGLSRYYGRTLLTFALCTTVALVATALTEFSKMHLLWMLPVAFIVSLVLSVRRGAPAASEVKDDGGQGTA